MSSSVELAVFVVSALATTSGIWSLLTKFIGLLSTKIKAKYVPSRRVPARRIRVKRKDGQIITSNVDSTNVESIEHFLTLIKKEGSR